MGSLRMVGLMSQVTPFINLAIGLLYIPYYMTSLFGHLCVCHKYGPQSSRLPQMQPLPEVSIIMSMSYQSISNGRKRHIIPYEIQGQHPSSLHFPVKLFPNNDRAPLKASIPAGLIKNAVTPPHWTFSGDVLQINRNPTDSSENLDFFTLSNENLLPPPPTLSTPLKKQVKHIHLRRCRGGKERGVKPVRDSSASLLLLWNQDNHIARNRQ